MKISALMGILLIKVLESTSLPGELVTKKVNAAF